MMPATADVRLILCLALAVAGWAYPAIPTAQPAAESGGEAYLRHCARCHQADGRGVAGRYPSLHTAAGNWRDRDAAIRAVLDGRRGPTESTAIMPTHGYLGNEIVAETLSYVLAQWSPSGAAVTPEEVAAVRMELLTRHPTTTDSAPGPSPLADMEATQYVTSDGPPLTVEEFEQARRLYYGRCTGCHGVMREGTAGNPLTPEYMREVGTQYLQSVVSYGSATGMPNWGTSDELSAEEINLLARFLQHPVPQPPDMNAAQIRDGWRQYRVPTDRPVKPMHAYDLDRLFAVTLHDVGEIALFDGVSRTLITRVPVGHAPHRLTASSSGRYLYVIGRDGTVSLIDLFAAPPERVASARIGYEARAVGASRYPGYEDRFALAGAYWPPQVVLLDGATLEPLQVVSTRDAALAAGSYHAEPRVTDVTGSPSHPEFISQIKETGQVYLIPYGSAGAGDAQAPRALKTATELRAGSFSVDGRYHLTPADSNAVSVLDVAGQRIVAEIPARVFGGNSGTSFLDPVFGPVWATTSMVTNDLMVFGTDPDQHPQHAWKLVQQVAGPSTGSLFLATHPASRHLWMDTPLTRQAEYSQSVSVFRKGRLADGYQTLPVARWSGLTDGPRRVLQPAYSADGTEVWLLVWNPQDESSAIVVVDDATLAHRATIRLPDLITPTRIYNVLQLRGRTAGEIGASATATAPDDAVPRYSGVDLFLEHCGGCHGRFGEGDGLLAPAMPYVLKDLRYLSARNDGEFPRAYVTAVIDGREMRAEHGPEGMPVWGEEFGRWEERDAPARADAKLRAVVDFLEDIQILR
jgi:nitrite reductase (NO-forming) / hydroxylamine reductase